MGNNKEIEQSEKSDKIEMWKHEIQKYIKMTKGKGQNGNMAKWKCANMKIY